MPSPTSAEKESADGDPKRQEPKERIEEFQKVAIQVFLAILLILGMLRILVGEILGLLRK